MSPARTPTTANPVVISGATVSGVSGVSAAGTVSNSATIGVPNSATTVAVSTASTGGVSGSTASISATSMAGGTALGSSCSSSFTGVTTSLDTIAERQLLVVASDKQTKIFDVFNQCCINRTNISEMDFAVKSETIAMEGNQFDDIFYKIFYFIISYFIIGGSCLATYLSNGHIVIHSLPNLKLLLDVEFLPLMDLR